MDNLFNLDVEYDMTLDEMFESKEYNEFGYNLQLLDELYVDPFTEEVVDTTAEGTFNRVKSKAGEIVKNTSDTTKDVLGAYENITDANATLIKNTWDLMMGGIKLTVKMASFIIRNVAKIPGFINNTGKKIGNLGQNIKNKIQGNITLHITADDVQMLYNKSLINRLTSFISHAEELAKGDTWNMAFDIHWNKNKVVKVTINKHDLWLCEQMKESYTGLDKLKFNPTTVEMKNQNVINTYFGDEKIIKYELDGKKYESTYYDSLAKLVELLAEHKSSIETIQDSIKDKINTSNSGASGFSKFSTKEQAIIKEAVRQIAKVTGIIGNISNYIIKDMKTISSTVDKLIAKGKIGGEESTESNE